MNRKRNDIKRNTAGQRSIPIDFKNIVEDMPLKKYASGFHEVMAAELRGLLLEMGTALIENLKKGDVYSRDSLNALLKQLEKCWPDPVSHERDILKIQKEVTKKFKITLTNRR